MATVVADHCSATPGRTRLPSHERRFPVGGLIVTAVLGITGEKYGNYGEVSIPGSGVVRLPAGEVIVSFGTSDHQDITPPAGASYPLVTEDLGDMVAAVDDAHRRVWFMKVATAGDYRVIADGPVADFVDSHLSFGQSLAVDGPLWFLVALSVISVDLAIAMWWFRRRGRVGTGEDYCGSAGFRSAHRSRIRRGEAADSPRPLAHLDFPA